MRKLLCTVVLFIAAMGVLPSAQAAYLGKFTRSTGTYYFEVLTSSKVAVTIIFVTSKGRWEVDEVLTFDVDHPVFEPKIRTLPRNVDRIIIMADAPLNTPGETLRVTSGTSQFEVPILEHATAVIDLID